MTKPPSGILFFIVGPSGAGKDSLIDGLRARLDSAGFVFARRVITRSADAGGELHEAVSLAEFLAREARGEFLVSWQAHGLHYGIPASVCDALAQGRHVLANGSRSAAAMLSARVPNMVLVSIEAPPELLAARLAARGREDPQAIAKRLARRPAVYPPSLRRITIQNDRDLPTGVARLEGAIKLAIAPEAEPRAPREIMLHKLAGVRLSQANWAAMLDAVLAGEITGEDLRAILITCATELDDDELLSIARWRSGLMPRIDWGERLVVDKHSLGGTAGSRVTMVVIPIVAAHGLTMPKTSSRAITSAAGTADAMEVLARVDLTPAELKTVVARAKACIAWNGRLNHSVLDDAMHAIEREYGLDTRRWSVASILSKKFSAGSTHVVIDIPYMPSGKVADLEQARAMAALFEAIGQRLGLVVRAFPSDGSAPIGRGIGPALEARDVLQVLRADPDAPADLRDKSLLFAGHILAFDPAVGSAERGLARAQQLLREGSALKAFEAVIDAQGRRPPPDATSLQRLALASPETGRIAGIHARRVAAIARAAGAPQDPLAGVDLACQLGASIKAGEPLYVVQGRHPERLEAALALAAQDTGVSISRA